MTECRLPPLTATNLGGWLPEIGHDAVRIAGDRTIRRFT